MPKLIGLWKGAIKPKEPIAVKVKALSKLAAQLI